MSSGFITENEVQEAKKRRQEEWLKVRKPEDPIERPEDPVDNRSLYEKLKEQKMKKDLEYEETHKLKNLIRGLDDDEVHFLDLVDSAKINAERRQHLEEEKELREFREKVAILHEKSMEEKFQSEVKPKTKISTPTTSRPSQKALINNVIRKRKADEALDNSKSVATSGNQNNASIKNGNNLNKIENSLDIVYGKTKTVKIITVAENKRSLDKGALKCIGILPGIGRYHESSDSEMSSESEEEALSTEKYDLVGRKKLQLCELGE